MNLPALTTLLPVLLVVPLAGCTGSGQSTGRGSAYQSSEIGSCSWDVVTSNPVGGVDYACVGYAKSGDRLVVLLWTDLQAGGAHTRSSSLSDSFSVQGSFESSDLKKPIAFHCQGKGPDSESLTIDAVTYDLAKGRLFLISTNGERLVAKQFQRDMTQLKVDADSLKALAKMDPDIAGFFGMPEKGQPTP